LIETVHTPGCPGHEEPFLVARDRNRRLSRETFTYLRCDTCGLVRLANPPADLGKFYPESYYALPSRQRLAEIAARNPFKIDLIRRFTEPGRLLEIGPAFGVFVFQAQQAGYDVSAIEMDARCCDYLANELRVDARKSDAPEQAMEWFPPQDVIALWHVIEHLPDPWALLGAAAGKLKPGGTIVVATPNPLAWQFGVMGALWPHIDAPRHLYLLPSRTIVDFVRRFGLSCVHVGTDDEDARSWNRFGWQRLLMNISPEKWTQRAAYMLGWALSAVMAPMDRRDGAGSAYTLVLRKDA
jgi:SAM-dependent methyltransferase